MDPLLRQLVAIPSVTGDRTHAKKIIAFCARELQDCGMHVATYISGGYSSLIATTRPTTTPTVLLAAHLDVVSAPEHMFDLRLESGVYYGRGVWDMKFAAAAYIHLARELGPRLTDYNFGIMLTTDEELYGHYGTGLIIDKKGYRPKVCILPDAIEPRHIQAYGKGCYFIELTALGVSAHGSRPWEGDSATIKLTHALHDIAETFTDGQQPDTNTLNIGMIQGGKTPPNQIPDNAMAMLDIRYLDNNALSSILRNIKNICSRHGVRCRPIGRDRWPTTIDLSNPYITTYLRHYHTQKGITPQPYNTSGTSDARFFAKLDIPVVLCSPDGGGAHSDNEWLDATDYANFQLLIRAYLDDVAYVPTHIATNKPTVALTTTP